MGLSQKYVVESVPRTDKSNAMKFRLIIRPITNRTLLFRLLRQPHLKPHASNREFFSLIIEHRFLTFDLSLMRETSRPPATKRFSKKTWMNQTNV